MVTVYLEQLENFWNSLWKIADQVALFTPWYIFQRPYFKILDG